MKKLWLVVVSLALLTSFCAFAQEPEPPKPAPEPEPAGEQPKEPGPEEKPKPEEKPEEGKIVVYIDVKDYVDDKPYKWRGTEYLIEQTFRLANKENKEEIKKEWRERHDWSKYKGDVEKKIEKDYRDLRKKKGVDRLDLSHLKIVRWRPRPKEPKEDKEEKKEGEGKDEDGEKEGQEPEESGEEPVEPGEEAPKKPEKPEKPKPKKKKKWVDPKETADYLILGEAKFKTGKKAVYFGETVAWNSLGELHIRVIRRIDSKVIKEFKDKFKRSHTLGQERAHQQCMQDLGQKVASAIVKLPEFRKK